MFAWNFVVLGLFVVMAWPLVEAFFIGTDSAGHLRIFFMSATIAVGILNYLPTRLAPAALLLAAACAAEMMLLFAPAWLAGEAAQMIAAGLLAAVPWVGWSCLRKPAAELGTIDRLWLDFRDAWGLMWSQRVREQFNRTAENAGYPVTLTWSGVRGDGHADDKTLEEIFARSCSDLSQRSGNDLTSVVALAHGTGAHPHAA